MKAPGFHFSCTQAQVRFTKKMPSLPLISTVCFPKIASITNMSFSFTYMYHSTRPPYLAGSTTSVQPAGLQAALHVHTKQRPAQLALTLGPTFLPIFSVTADFCTNRRHLPVLVQHNKPGDKFKTPKKRLPLYFQHCQTTAVLFWQETLL